MISKSLRDGSSGTLSESNVLQSRSIGESMKSLLETVAASNQSNKNDKNSTTNGSTLIKVEQASASNSTNGTKKTSVQRFTVNDILSPLDSMGKLNFKQ
ncbi:unnamed protein product [Thelazia callipaeda]|uniref:Uncharacterized protein n=1 Tax=Thelazia callipaeda TaxID=103827 RepID=A0A0N5CSH3_THECL|nr:unnamed protein product [Thelazia callipaeda]